MFEQNENLKCLILTPEAQKVQAEATDLVLPAHDGLIGVLPGHAPLLCILEAGLVRFIDNRSRQQTFFVDGGFAHIRNNNVTILTRRAIAPDEITITRANKRLKQAKDMPTTSIEDVSKRNIAIKRAKNLITLAQTA